VRAAVVKNKRQVKVLASTINSCDCYLVVSATPVDLARLMTIDKPLMRVRYSYRDNSEPTLGDLVKELLEA